MATVRDNVQRVRYDVQFSKFLLINEVGKVLTFCLEVIVVK